MSQLHAAASGTRPAATPDARRPGDPVEFNHAISYVNKIKTRFASQPDIYRTFLEILQTYQREQLRISEVYTQVTLLFREAPDLLNDFRQFLPDMTQQPAQDQNEVKLPPVGNFAPPTQVNPTTPQVQQQPLPNEPYAPPASSGRGKKRVADQYPQNGNVNHEEPSQSIVRTKKAKRKTTNQAKTTSAKNDMKEEHTLFDKIKKVLSPESLETFYDTIQLFYTQKIDLSTLVEQAEKLLKGSPEIIKSFKKYVGYKGPVHVDNVPYSSNILEYSQISSNNDQSYRHVLKSESQLPCSGRDEMCWEVLNDEWVSQHTRQSGNTGTKSRRRNKYEEILNRVEEERHEFDYYIEANLRTMQTLESITNRIANMTPEEKNYFKLPPNLGHTSTIYEKVLKKIYGDQRYQEVVEALRETPSIAVPVVLRRLRQKDEEWKRGLREWNKVWRNTEEKVYYKSLDHQGLLFKEDDKVYLDPKSIISEIIDLKTARENSCLGFMSTNTQRLLATKMEDTSIFKDIFNLLSVYIQHKVDSNDKKRAKLTALLKNLLILLFSLPKNFFDKTEDSKNILSITLAEKKRESAESVSLKSLLDNAQKEDLSIESTQQIIKVSPQEGKMWLQNLISEDDSSSVNPAITVDSLFANATIYIFVRLITVLYERLAEVKNLEAVVSKEIGKGIKIQYGLDFGFTDDRLDNLNLTFTSENVYGQLLKYVGTLFEGGISTDTYEEIVRQSYKNRAVKLYTVENLAKVITVYLDEILQSPKAAGLVLLNDLYREQGAPTAKSIIVYRTKALALNDPVTSLFQINFDRTTKEISFEFLEDQLTYDDEVEAINRWTRYISDFSLSDPTPNVPVESVKLPFLNKSLRESTSIGNLTSEEKLGIKVCPKSYRLFFDANTEEFFAKNSISFASKGAVKKTWFKQFLDGPKGWRADLNEESQLEAEGKFETWKQKGPDAMNSWQPPAESAERDKKISVTPPAKKAESPVSGETANIEDKKTEREVSPKEQSEVKADGAPKAAESNPEPVEKADVEMKDVEPETEKEDVEMKDVEPEASEPSENAPAEVATNDTAITTAEKTAEPVPSVTTDALPDQHAQKSEPDEQTSEKPVSEEQVAKEPVSEKQVIEKPVAEEPVTEKPATEESVVEKPVTEEQVVEKPATEELVAEKSVTEEPVAEEPVIEKPVTEEPVSEKPVSEKPVTEEPVTEKPITEEPAAEKPASETPVAEKPASETSVVEKAASETPASEKPADDNAAISDRVTTSIEPKPESTPTEPEGAKEEPASPAKEEQAEPTSTSPAATATAATGSPEPAITNPEPESISQDNTPSTQK